MTTQKEKETLTLTSYQNQDQRGEDCKIQSDQDQDSKPGDKRSVVNNDQQKPSKTTKIEMGQKFEMTKKKKKKKKLIHGVYMTPLRNMLCHK